jgi:hypothetical protein
MLHNGKLRCLHLQDVSLSCIDSACPFPIRCTAHRILQRLSFFLVRKSILIDKPPSFCLYASTAISQLTAPILHRFSLVKKKSSYPHNRRWRPMGMGDVKDSRLSRPGVGNCFGSGPLCGSGGWRRAAPFKMIAFIS